MQVFSENHANHVIPLGVSKQGDLVYFAVSVPNAKECKLLLYKDGCKTPKKTMLLAKENRIGSVFTTQIPWNEFHYDSYCYEAMGKEFIDPYAKRIVGRDVYGKALSPEEKELVKGAFDFDEFNWEGDIKPEISYSDLILYKLHVRGFTMDVSSKVKHRGTYLGLIEKIPYLKELGVNGLLLMPSVEFPEVIESNYNTPSYFEKSSYISYNQALGYNQQEDFTKINYWGYMNEHRYQYFAPKATYAFHNTDANIEFKTMVRELHKHGIEVHMEMHFVKGTTYQLIQDCLRFWAMEYHIDGFRFTNEIGIELSIASDPYLARTKLISHSFTTDMIYEKEIAPEYKVLADYNDRFLVDIRRFLKGDEDQLATFAEHFRCSHEKKGCIHYVTEHNGFTLMDLYSYDVKHNEDSGENNRDGTDYNYSWNCGVEGQTRKKKIIDLRTRMRKNALVVLILSQGTPMLYAGDEFGNSQKGNNNAYCIDNSTSWLNWKDKKNKDSLFTFTKELISLRKRHKILRNDKAFLGMDYFACGYPDISFHGVKAWRPEYFNYSRTLGIFLYGKYAKLDEDTVDDSFYFAFNMHWEEHRFDLPDLPRGFEWKLLFVTDKSKEMDFLNEEEQMTSKERQEVAKSNEGIAPKVKIPKVRNLVQKQYIDLSPRSIAVFISQKKVSD